MDKKSSPSLVDALFGKTKKLALGILFAKPEKSWHLRELARLAGVSPTMLSKEMDLLSAAGIVVEEKDGNRRRLRANAECPIFEELRGIARKTMGLGDILRDCLASIDGIDSAFIFGSVAQGAERADSDVDVCVIGDVSYEDLLKELSSAEKTIGRIINPVLYKEKEIGDKIVQGNPFIMRMLSSKRIPLIGDCYGEVAKFGGDGAT